MEPPLYAASIKEGSERMSDKWKIRVHGYGTFDFEGTETEAEEMRAHKAQWERGTALKWRPTGGTELDRVTEEVVALLDSGKGIPASLWSKRAKLIREQRAQ
jgi:hypothetical protein